MEEKHEKGFGKDDEDDQPSGDGGVWEQEATRFHCKEDIKTFKFH